MPHCDNLRGFPALRETVGLILLKLEAFSSESLAVDLGAAGCLLGPVIRTLLLKLANVGCLL